MTRLRASMVGALAVAAGIVAAFVSDVAAAGVIIAAFFAGTLDL